MMKKGDSGKRFSKNICSHLGRRNPDSRKRTFSDMVTDKVMADIDMYRTIIGY